MLFAKVIRVPGAVVEVGLEEGATVQDALDAADVSVAENEAITVNGMAATTATLLPDGARLVVARGAKSATRINL
jgi:UPF0288 family protein (methanogenesis marker protein 3)